jgi:hypothetical protein
MRCSALRHQGSDELRDNGRPLEWTPADSTRRAVLTHDPSTRHRSPCNKAEQDSSLVAWNGAGERPLAAGASFSHHAQGGGIWPDGAGMPDPSRKRPTNQPGT